MRQSLAKKKSTTVPILSKQEQSLVQAQIEKETKIRRHVSEIKTNLDRALQIISHLALGKIDDMRLYVSQILDLLLSSGALDKGTLLVGTLAFTTFLVWATPSPVPDFRANIFSGGVNMLFRSIRYVR